MGRIACCARYKLAIDIDIDIDIDIEKIVAVAINAGKEILEIYQKDDFGKRKKLDDSPLTEADIASHNVIIRQLQKLTPAIPVLSDCNY